MSEAVTQVIEPLEDVMERMDVKTVFGEPFREGDVTIIPVAEVTYAFEVGVEEEAAADGTEGGGGGSGGMDVRPVAVVEVTPENTLVKPIIDEQKLAFAGALLIGWAVFCVARTLVKIFGQRD